MAAQHGLTNTGERIGEPAWSADGTRLAYDDAPFHGGLCGYCGGSVALADPNGHKLSLVPGAIPDQESSEGSPAWSPSGGQLPVTKDFNAGCTSPRSSRADRARRRRLARLVSRWHNGGVRRLVQRGRHLGVDPTAANPRRLLPASTLEAVGVAWSPDGSLLAFSTSTGIFLAPVDGSAMSHLVVATRGAGRPGFSHDGKWLAFSARAGRAHPYSAISVVGVDGTGLRQLTTGPFDSFDPAWRPVKTQS